MSVLRGAREGQQAAAAVPLNPFDALPDHLLLNVFRRLPEVYSYDSIFRQVWDEYDDEEEDLIISSRRVQPGPHPPVAAWPVLCRVAAAQECYSSAETLQLFMTACRGSAEYACQRWRRLAHSLPAACLNLDFTQCCDFGSGSRVLAALAGRACRAVKVINAPEELPLSFWIQLGQGPAAEARSLTIRENSDMFSAFAAGTLILAQQCCQLEELCMDISGMEEGTLALPRQLAITLPALPRLRRVNLSGISLEPELAAALADLPQLESAGLSSMPGLPEEAAWPPLARMGTRLQRLDFPLYADYLSMRDGIFHIPDGMLVLTGLGELDIQLTMPLEGGFLAHRLGGLDALPALHTLTTDCGAPQEVWTCPGLTYLHIQGPSAALPAPGCAGQLSPLRELELHRCLVDDAAGFPEVLCQLSGLTRLEMSECTLRPQAALPPHFSQLRELRALLICGASRKPGHGTCLDAASMAALSLLTALTQLKLTSCKLAELPPGPYLEDLAILDISSNPFQPNLLPIIVTGAPRLKKLGLSLPVNEAELVAGWPQVQSVLQQLPNLQCLAACFAPIGGTDWQRLNASGPVIQAMARLHQLAAAAGLAFTISSSLSF